VSENGPPARLTLAGWLSFPVTTFGVALLLLGVDSWVGSGCVSNGPAAVSCPATSGEVAIIALGAVLQMCGVGVLLFDLRRVRSLLPG